MCSRSLSGKKVIIKVEKSEMADHIVRGDYAYKHSFDFIYHFNFPCCIAEEIQLTGGVRLEQTKFARAFFLKFKKEAVKTGAIWHMRKHYYLNHLEIVVPRTED